MANRLRPQKTALIDWAVRTYEIKSIADLGGCWGVHGGYTIRAVMNHPLTRAVLVDGNITDDTRRRAAKYPQVELVEGALGDDAVIERVGKVDAAIMFDILLHQVDPDWPDLLAKFSATTDTLIIYNQGWLGDETVRFVDFSVEDYLRRVPHTDPVGVRDWYKRHHEYHAGQRKRLRDIHNFWQWGITQKDLVGVLWDLGYRIDRLMHYGGFRDGFPDVDLVGLVGHKRLDVSTR